MGKDLYKTLGISKTATHSDIKKAYRKKAKEFHPDKNPNSKEAETKFKEIGEAYEILSDEKKRRRYDSLGYDAYMNGPQNGGFNDMTEMFNEIRKQQQREGERFRFSIQQTIRLTMKDVYNGVTKKFKYNRRGECKTCDGMGGEGITNCKLCNGNGVIKSIENTPFGRMEYNSPCYHCNATGKTVDVKCGTCNGNRYYNEELTINVDINHSVMTNEQIFLEGKGHFYVSNGEKCYGDLIFIIIIEDDKFQMTQNYGLISKIEIPYEIMILGGEVDFKTIDDSIVRLKVNKLTKIGHKMKLNGKGLKNRSNPNFRGDQYLIVDLKFPESITTEEEKILNDLKKYKKLV